MYLGLNAQRRGSKGQKWLQFLLERLEGEKAKQVRFNGTKVIAVNGRLDKLKNIYLMLCSLSSS